jgi:insertion element IS1 protein InsB
VIIGSHTKALMPGEKHLQTKAETFTVEEYNSLFKHFLARMRRKSECYSKKMEMLKISIYTVVDASQKWNITYIN